MMFRWIDCTNICCSLEGQVVQILSESWHKCLFALILSVYVGHLLELSDFLALLGSLHRPSGPAFVLHSRIATFGPFLVAQVVLFLCLDGYAPLLSYFFDLEHRDWSKLLPFFTVAWNVPVLFTIQTENVWVRATRRTVFCLVLLWVVTVFFIINEQEVLARWLNLVECIRGVLDGGLLDMNFHRKQLVLAGSLLRDALLLLLLMRRLIRCDWVFLILFIPSLAGLIVDLKIG